MALLTQYADEAFNNAMFTDVLSTLDAAIASGADNYIAEATQYPTVASCDAMALYLNDYADGEQPVMVALTKYIQKISKLEPQFFDSAMKGELHRSGFLGMYQGIDLYGISSAKKFANGDLLIPDKRVFGICGRIGNLTRKGDVDVYQVENPNTEQIHLLFKNFAYGISYNSDTIKKVAKMVMA